MVPISFHFLSIPITSYVVRNGKKNLRTIFRLTKCVEHFEHDDDYLEPSLPTPQRERIVPFSIHYRNKMNRVIDTYYSLQNADFNSRFIRYAEFILLRLEEFGTKQDYR